MSHRIPGPLALALLFVLATPAAAAGPPSTASTPERVVSMRQSVLSHDEYVRLRDAWREYTRRHPRDPLGWAQLARAASYAGSSCDEFVKYAKKAVELGPDDAQACATLGRFLWHTYCGSQPSEPKQAMKLLEHALHLDPSLDDPHYILWTMLQSEGRTSEANAHLRTLLDDGRMPEPLVDFAYNLLAGLDPKAILLTNGDNDTYPLIALQTARNVRTDVAVVNLSLLNLEWYRRQLRNGPLAVPVPLLEGSTKDLHSYEQSEEALKGLIANLARDGWNRPLYASVTVASVEKRIPDERLLEGLVYRVLPEAGTDSRVDVAAIEHNFDHVYRLQSVKSLSVDWNSWSALRQLMFNYESVMWRIAPALADDGRLEDARKRIAWMLDVAHFHHQDRKDIAQWINAWSQRDPKCPDLDRWRAEYLQ